MSKQVSTPTAVAIIAVIALVAIFIGWRMINSNPTPPKNNGLQPNTMKPSRPAEPGKPGSGPQMSSPKGEPQ